MMFKLVEYKPDHAIEIIKAGAVEPDLALDDGSLEFVNSVQTKGPCITGMYDGRPVSCGGIQLMWPGTAEAWFLNIFNIGDYHIDPQIAKGWIRDRIDENKIGRLQTPLKSNFVEGEVYAKWLGFEFEAVLEEYHKDGSDARMYKIITRRYVSCHYKKQL